MTFKEACLPDFVDVEEIGEEDMEDIDERAAEQEIVHNIKVYDGVRQGFYIREEPLRIGSVRDRTSPDLIFFKRELNALAMTGLKREDSNLHIWDNCAHIFVLQMIRCADFMKIPPSGESFAKAPIKNIYSM